jgi:L-ribulose-5-phosphate 4-epimerase
VDASRARDPDPRTTHADLPGACRSRALTEREIDEDYEGATGQVLIEAVGERGSDEVPAALVLGHGPFCWAEGPAAAVENAVILEEVARIAALTVTLEPGVGPLAEAVRDKHFSRKHGPQAYYGQAS